MQSRFSFGGKTQKSIFFEALHTFEVVYVNDYEKSFL